MPVVLDLTSDAGKLTDWINVALTIAIVFLAIVNWQIAARIKWLTGAMERHSDQQRQIAAHQAGIEMRWWDKERDPDRQFPHQGGHNQVHYLDRIYIGIPEHLRFPWRLVRSVLRLAPETGVQ